MAIKISFTGDVSFNGYYHKMANANEDPFKEISNRFNDSDLVVVNLEAVCESPIKEQHKKETKLSIHPSTIKFLRTINTGLVTLANNHIYDNLQSGFEFTINLLEDENINYTGAYIINKEQDPFFFNSRNINIAFLNYVHELTHPGVYNDDAIQLNIYNKEIIVSEILKQKKKNDYVILILHWGQDNSRYPAPWQRKDAKDFVEAGVNIIIGHHSHVLQGFERIKNSFVFYGLGNLAFSPIKSEDKLDQGRQVETIILNLYINENEIDFDLLPIQISDHSPKVINNSSFSKLSNRIKYVSNSYFWPLYLIYLNIIYKIFFFFFGNDRKPITQLKKIDFTIIKRFIHLCFHVKN